MQTGSEITDAMVTLLEGGAGYGIYVQGLDVHLNMYQLPDKRFIVGVMRHNAETNSTDYLFDEIYDEASKAVAFFETMRNKEKV